MHAHLLIGNRGVEKKIEDIVDKDSKPINFSLQKIDDVRSLQSLTKFQGKEKRYFVLKDFQNSTVESMNAFLKLLEEPGENINFILCASNDRNILETIISRCNVIRLGHSINSKDISSAKKYFRSHISFKLKTLHQINNREMALDFLTMLIEGGHALLIEDPHKYAKLSKVIRSAIEIRQNIINNANVTIALTKFSLDLV
ncbi:hypothetical protein JXA63_02865 [Candidatus Woesebacteria bacterium]|nr:hypothetical protein [Candidatus Woesebacteria bacterium]